nr:PREDICTED: MAX gene-associated protein isoform X1 [Lepisosteus oculatus]
MLAAVPEPCTPLEFLTRSAPSQSRAWEDWPACQSLVFRECELLKQSSQGEEVLGAVHPTPARSSVTAAMEKQAMMVLADEGRVPPIAPASASTPPAFFVILKPGQAGDGGLEQQGILVSNQDVNLATNTVASIPSPGLLPLAPRNAAGITPIKPKNLSENLPPESSCRGVKVTLDNNNMWNEFYRCRTEMILTKQGRRMFPYCRFRISGMEPFQRYILVMDITPMDNNRYKWNGRYWEINGKAEPHVLGRVFIHPESPSSGHYWMQQPVSFYKLKLTNNTLDQEGHVILHSMHRYLPRLHIVPADKATEVIQLNGPDVMTFTFPQTEFFAVTAYQNLRITQLKIDYNPFAKGFREDGQCYRPIKFKGDAPATGGSDPKASPFPPLDLSKTSHSGEEGKPPRKTLKSLFGSPEVFDEVMDQELFGSEGYDIGFLNDEILPIKSNATPKTSSNRKPPRTSTPVPTQEGNVRGKKDGPDTKRQSSSELFRMARKEDGESPVDNGGSQKEQHDTQLGVAKAKVFSIDSGRPAVCIKPCSDFADEAATPEVRQERSSAAPFPDVHPPEKDKGGAGITDLPVKVSPVTPSETEKPALKDILQLQQKGQPVPPPKAFLFQETQEKISSILSAKRPIAPKPPPDAKGLVSSESLLRPDKQVSSSEAAAPSAIKSPKILHPPGKKRRQRKVRFGKVGKPSKKTGVTGTGPVLGSPTDASMQPDLEEVEGVLFVSFTSKDALEIHLGDQPQGGDTIQPPETAEIPEKNEVPESLQDRILRLQDALLKDLKRFKHRQAIHPVLQEVGLKLNFVDPSLAIDLKYLGVRLPLPPPVPCAGTDGNPAAQTSSPDVPFISRTGKTNDFTKIKGWREKFNVNSEASSSRTEGSGGSEGALKNRSAFCSDMLDEYLENEGKLIDERAASFSQSTTLAPVAYQLPTKSTSYVRTLDSVLKKQAPALPPPSPSFPFKAFSTPKRPKAAPKQKASPKPTASPGVKAKPGAAAAKRPPSHSAKQKTLPSYSAGKPAAKTKSAPIFYCPASSAPLEPGQEQPVSERLVLKQEAGGRPVAAASSRVAGLSKSLARLMDLEDGALWEGKGRTYVTEERAEVALASLLTAQGSLKGRPVGRIIKRRAPPCLNDFCRLGCVCASLAQERRLPTHCRKPECMFGCTCLKRKVVLVKTSPKRKKTTKAADPEDLIFYKALGEEEEEEDGEEEEEGMPLKAKKKKRRKIEYTISEPEPESEPAARVYTLWNRKEGEIDPEPLFIPPPSACYSQSSSSGFPRVSGSTRSYIPKAHPVVTEEEKDPVYLYFESMMTCARVRHYAHKRAQSQPLCACRSVLCSGREDDPYHRFMDSKTDGKPGMLRADTQVSAPTTPQKIQPRMLTPSEPTRMLEIVSECNWEQERDRILRTVSQHMAQNNLAQSFKVGRYLIEQVSQSHKKEGSGSVITSTIRISLPAAETDGAERTATLKEEQAEGSASARKKELEVVEMPSEGTSKCAAKKLRKMKDKLSRGKALPFYTGVSPAGILTANKKQPGSPQQGLIKVNGKSYPQAKLLLGQMGALHPANRLAAYITGRLRPSALEASSTALLKQSKGLPSGEGLDTGLTVDGTNEARGSQRPSLSAASSTACSGTTTVSLSSGTASPGITTVTQKLSEETPTPTAPAMSVPSGGSPTGGVNPTNRRPGTRLLLIPVQPSSPAVRPATPSLGPQLSPGQRMVLQPVRSSTGTTLFRHPNGQLIQLVPLSQLRTVQPNVLIRNPGSVIRLPAPPHPPPDSTTPPAAAAKSPVCSTAVLAGLSPSTSATSPTSGSKASAAAGSAPSAVSQAAKTGTVPSIMGHTETYTLRISPATGTKLSVQGPESKLITYSSGGQLPGSQASVLPITSGGFTLLQIPKTTAASAAKPSSELVQPVLLEVQKQVPKAKGSPKAPQEHAPAHAEVVLQQVKVKEAQKASDPAKTQQKEESPDHSEAEDTDASLQDVTPAGIVSSDHSYTSGRDPVELKGSDSDHSYTSGQMQDSETLLDGSLPKPQSETDPELGVTNHKPSKTVLESGQPAPIALLSGSSKSSVSCVKDSLAKNSSGETCAESSTSKQSLPRTFSKEDVSSGKSGETRPGRPASEEEGSESLSCTEPCTHPSVDTKDWTRTKSGESSRVEIKEEVRNLEEGEVEGVEGEQTGDSEVDVEEEDESEDDSEEEDNEPASEESDLSEEDEAIDIETVEELSEKINIARLKAVAVQMKLDKVRSIHEAKRKASGMKPKLKLQPGGREEDEVGSASSLRINHTVNERRRRSELRELFDNMKKVLGLENLPKASKFYILRQALNEIQALVDESDRLEAQKNMLMRKRSVFIKKVAQTSGKTEELIIKKLEYICAKQKSLETQRKKLAQRNSSKTVTTQPHPEPALSMGSLTSPSSPVRRPLILSKRRSSAPQPTGLPSSVSSPLASPSLSAGSSTVPAEGSILTFKAHAPAPSPLSSTILHSDTNALTAEIEGVPISSIPGVASVTIEVPGISLPFQVKNFPELSIPVSAPNKDSKPAQAKDNPAVREGFSMPKIVSLASLLSSKKAADKKERRNRRIPDEHGASQSLSSSLDCGLELKKDQAPSGMAEQRDAPKSSSAPVSHKKKEEGLDDGEITGDWVMPIHNTRETTDDVDDPEDGEKSGRSDERSGLSLVGDLASSQEDEDDDDDEDEDSEDETLTSLLNEIVFLNQQMNNDSSGLPAVTQARFAHRSLLGQKKPGAELSEEEGSSKQGEGGAEPDEDSALSPLFLQLDEDLLKSKDLSHVKSKPKSARGDYVKSVIGSELLDSVPKSNRVANGCGQQSPPQSGKGGSLTPPPLLQMKAGIVPAAAASSRGTSNDGEVSWRPMPRLAPLGLKTSSNPSLDSLSLSSKAMKSLAPVNLSKDGSPHPSS